MKPNRSTVSVQLFVFGAQTAEILFFVVDNQTRSTASMVEAAHLAGWTAAVVAV